MNVISYLFGFVFIVQSLIALGQNEVPVFFEKKNSYANMIIPENPKAHLIKSGFEFVEGPVWNKDGYLLFSDLRANKIYKYTPGKGVEVFLEPSGISNGLTYDKDGNLIICEHEGRLSKLDKSNQKITLVEKYEAKRLNSPNDVVLRGDGSLYFTDPPYGLKGQDNSPAKELEFNGIFRFKDGHVTLISKDLNRPNGIAFSPDESILYVSNRDPNDKYWWQYEISTDGQTINGREFFRINDKNKEGGPDGLKVDIEGNVYCTELSGILVLSPKGEHILTIKIPEIPANIAWGGKDNRTLFITARTSLYSIKLNIPGYIPF